MWVSSNEEKSEPLCLPRSGLEGGGEGREQGGFSDDGVCDTVGDKDG